MRVIKNAIHDGIWVEIFDFRFYDREEEFIFMFIDELYGDHTPI